MYSNEDHSGVFAFLIGMIVLVMAGVGLSLVVDRKFKWSNGINAIRREIRNDASELADLASHKEARARLLSETDAKLRTTSVAHKGIARELETLRRRQADLGMSRSELMGKITALENEFSNYRAEYRRKTWAGAVGEKLGNLTLGGGREYRQAVITRVTAVGLEIRHEHGIARIHAPDLHQDLQDRFQWSDESRRQRLKEELENLEGNAGKSDAVLGTSEKRVREANAGGDAEKLEALRQKVSVLKAKVGKLGVEKSEAQSRARYGSETSVPGSLESWSARASRLGAELTRAQAALAIAKSDLAMVTPDDPLLRQVE